MAPASGLLVVTEPVEGYGLLSVLGRGGFAVVYRGVQPDIARPVAIKVMNFPLEDEASWNRFKRECSLSGRLSGHPNVVTVFQTGRAHDGLPFLVMELCESGSLRERLRSDGPLAADDVVTIIGKMAGALMAAHEEGVLHRDIKPENILVDRFGEPKLSDFGIARLAATAGDSSSTTSYTPDHCAPEQLNGLGATTASDVYSLASTAYHLLTGTSPFRTGGVESIGELITRKLQHHVPVIEQDIPDVLRWFITTGLALDPEVRPTLHDLVTRIGAWTTKARDRQSLAESTHDPDVTVARPRGEASSAPMLSMPLVTAVPTPSSIPPIPPAPATPTPAFGGTVDPRDIESTVVRRAPIDAVPTGVMAVDRAPAEPIAADQQRNADAVDKKHRRRALALAAACIAATIVIAGTAFAVASRGGDDRAGSTTDSTAGRATELSQGATTTASGAATSSVASASSVASDGSSTSAPSSAASIGAGPSSGGPTATLSKGTATTVGTAVLPATIVPPGAPATVTTTAVGIDTSQGATTTTRTSATPTTGTSNTGTSNTGTPATSNTSASTTRAPSTTSTTTATIAAGAPGTPVWNGVGERSGSYIVILFGGASANGSPITDYQVSVDGGPFNSVGLVTNWRHDGLNFGQTHSYLVRAVNSRGPGPAVSGTGSTTPFSVPPFPFCVYSMGINPNDYNVPTRAADPSDGAVCGSIFWQFNEPGQHITWYPPPAATQAATLRVRYSNGYGQAARVTVTASGETQTVTFPPTGSWQTWQVRDIPITLGLTTVRMDWSGASGYTGDDATSASLNIDQVRITVP